MGALFLGAGAAGGGLGAIGSLFGTILSGVATVLSVQQALKAGESEAKSYEYQADDARFDERQAEIEGVSSQTKIKKELLRALGENDVAYAAAGIDLGQGVAADNRALASKDAESQLTIDRTTTDARRAGYRARAAGYLRLAGDARESAKLKALGLGVSGFAQLFG